MAGEMRQAVPFTDVQVNDELWRGRIETNRRVTVRYCFQKCEETGRISNFAKASGLMPGEFEGIYYNDSDVYKVIEGAAYSLAAHPDPELDAYLDDLIATIAAAQQPDGYLNTYHTLVQPEKRWTDIRRLHELYCAGHLIEAAVAHHQATGKRSLLDVAIKLADHIDRTFGPGPGQKINAPGHEEIELALVKLHRLTGEQRYLKLAKFFIDQRGRAESRELHGIYAQDHIPVTEQAVAVGHAVRAMYLYCGMADVATLTGASDYGSALDRIWRNQIERKLYLTGGIGARHEGEAFGDDYELPNDTAYNETCAAIGNALWNHRMYLLHGDAKYIDVLERVIYNGFLSGVSLSGDRFFYPNPLASRGSYHRSPWFDCSCCPVNVVRFVPSVPGFIYAHDGRSIDVNLFIASDASIKLGSGEVRLRQETRYPWDGTIAIHVDPVRTAEFDLHIRIPQWVRSNGRPIPSDLYSLAGDASSSEQSWSIHINGKLVQASADDRGYARISRTWQKGDVLEINLPMPVRLVRAHEKVVANRDRIAITRGPIVYCVEAVDNGGHVRNLWLSKDAEFNSIEDPKLLGGVVRIQTTAMKRQRNESGDIIEEPVRLTAIPYYGWDNREAGEMAVWLPTKADLAQIVPPPTIASRAKASTSHCYSTDSVAAVNDQAEPSSSGDHSIPRLTWWNHRGTNEWVRYDFAAPQRVSSVEVYWFDDTGRGQCRVPQSWRLLYRDGDQWKPVKASAEFGVQADTFNRVTVDPVKTNGLRLEVQLQPGFSGGILEWRVN